MQKIIIHTLCGNMDGYKAEKNVQKLANEIVNDLKGKQIVKLAQISVDSAPLGSFLSFFMWIYVKHEFYIFHKFLLLFTRLRKHFARNVHEEKNE